MNRKKTARWLAFVAVGLFGAAWWLLFFSLLWWAALLSVSMLVFLVAHFIVAGRDADCGYRQTPFGHGPHPSVAPVIDLGRRRGAGGAK